MSRGWSWKLAEIRWYWFVSWCYLLAKKCLAVFWKWKVSFSFSEKLCGCKLHFPALSGAAWCSLVWCRLLGYLKTLLLRYVKFSVKVLANWCITLPGWSDVVATASGDQKFPVTGSHGKLAGVLIQVNWWFLLIALMGKHCLMIILC